MEFKGLGVSEGRYPGAVSIQVAPLVVLCNELGPQTLILFNSSVLGESGANQSLAPGTVMRFLVNASEAE